MSAVFVESVAKAVAGVPADMPPSKESRRVRSDAGRLRAGFPSDGRNRRKRRELRVRRPDTKDLYNFPVPSARLLREYFNLSQAETRLAQRIAQAEQLEDAAQALGVKLCTARSQLAAIFEKTVTCRQAELVALLSRLAHLNPSQ